jgi:hypothetical protein
MVLLFIDESRLIRPSLGNADGRLFLLLLERGASQWQGGMGEEEEDDGAMAKVAW